MAVREDFISFALTIMFAFFSDSDTQEDWSILTVRIETVDRVIQNYWTQMND